MKSEQQSTVSHSSLQQVTRRVESLLEKYVRENDIPIHKLVAITTDGMPTMRSVRLGFIALCHNDPDFQDFELSLYD